jgi:hypothetical protein
VVHVQFQFKGEVATFLVHAKEGVEHIAKVLPSISGYFHRKVALSLAAAQGSLLRSKKRKSKKLIRACS